MSDPLRREEKKDAPSEKRDDGPKKPDVSSPGKDNILKRMRKVDPKQSEKYKQRTGE